MASNNNNSDKNSKNSLCARYLHRVRQQFTAFFGCTSVHGFAYLVGYRNRKELAYWVFTVVVGLILSVYISYDTYQGRHQ